MRIVLIFGTVTSSASPSAMKRGTVRPKTIVYFERITFGTILLSALQQLAIAQGVFATIGQAASWYILILILF